MDKTNSTVTSSTTSPNDDSQNNASLNTQYNDDQLEQSNDTLEKVDMDTKRKNLDAHQTLETQVTTDVGLENIADDMDDDRQDLTYVGDDLSTESKMLDENGLEIVDDVNFTSVADNNLTLNNDPLKSNQFIGDNSSNSAQEDYNGLKYAPDDD